MLIEIVEPCHQPCAEDLFAFLGHTFVERDKPQLPSAEDLAKLKADAKIAAFLRNEPT
jgi:hypothetical protein